MRSGSKPRPVHRPAAGLLRAIYLPRSADAAAFAMATYTIPMLVLATTGSAALTGLAFMLEWIPRLMAFGLAGAVVDRYGTIRVFRLASVARAVVVGIAAVALACADGTLAGTVTVMLLAAIVGTVTEFSYIATETAGAVASREDGERAHRVQSVLLGIDQVAAFAGPALGGLLLQGAGPTALLATIGTVSALAALLAPQLAEARPDPAPVPVVQGLRTGWSTLRSLPTLAWLVAGLAISNLVTATLQAAAPVTVVQRFGYSSASTGLVWTAAAAASLLTVAACRFAIDCWGLWPVGALAATVATGAGLAVAQARTYPAYLVLVAILMAGEGGMTVVLRTLRSRLVPPAVFGSTLALTILIILIPLPLAGALVALTPPAALGHMITACAVLQGLGLAAAFTRLRTDPALRPAPAASPVR
ncbi:MFS transporter [Streptomyces sp. NBC_01537]|uniref:MFS transporter n=1 Tax=Streptomyces sp. NBC_01537 TaxID=2903896 RepID=UPI00386F32CD